MAREFAWIQYRDSLIGETHWDSELATLSALMDSKLLRQWWDKSGRMLFGANFVDYVDELLKNQPPTDRVWNASANWATPPSLDE